MVVVKGNPAPYTDPDLQVGNNPMRRDSYLTMYDICKSPARII
ncbi:hypothetical protein [Tabrizicola sp.]|nr:hypothetical protein [Tabrizicola sp.]